MKTEDLTHRIASLIKRGQEFSFQPSYDIGPMLQWMEVAFSVLEPLPEDQARFAKYSLLYKGHPRDRVLLGIDVLYNALINSMLEPENPATSVIILGGPDTIEPPCSSVPEGAAQPNINQKGMHAPWDPPGPLLADHRFRNPNTRLERTPLMMEL